VNAVEGFIFLILIYFLFYTIVKRAKENRRKAEHAAAQVGQVQRPAQPVKKPQPTPRREPVKAPMSQTTMTPEAPKEPYRPIQPTLLAGGMQASYTGSLGGTSMEGNASAEGLTFTQGLASSEGSASREGTASGEGGEVFTADVLSAAHNAYAMGVAHEAPPVLPNLWDRGALVQAVVMKEILDRPRGRRYGHG
jgi:hypothetical protein